MDDLTTTPTSETSVDDGKNTDVGTGADKQAAQSAEKKFAQADVDRIVSDRVAEEKKRAKKEADEAARVKAGEFEALASERKAALDAREAELETIKARAATLEAQLEAGLKDRIKALPEEMRELVVGQTVEDRAESLAKVEKAAQRMGVQRTPGTPRGPVGSGGISSSTLDQVVEAKRRSGNYGPM